MFKCRCGLCNIPVKPEKFKEHLKSLEHLINQKQMLDNWVKLNTMYKENPEETLTIIEGIKNGQIKRI